MTAQEYLEDLQAVYRRYDYLMEILLMRRDFLADHYDFGSTATTEEEMRAESAARSRDRFLRYARDFARTTVDKLLKDESKELREEMEAYVVANMTNSRPKLGWVEQTHSEFLDKAPDLASLDIAVGELETASFNASAIPVPGRVNSWVIALNQGVSAVVYEVACIIAGTFNVDIGEVRGSMALTPQQAGRILHERLNSYVHLGIPWGDEYNISREHRILASSVTTMTARFVYAHEMSHIILGHLDGAPLQALSGDWSGAEQTIHRFDQETDADLLAWELVTRAFVRSLSDLQMVYAGASLFLQVADLLERAEDLTAIGTHPPARKRLANLREGTRQTANEVKIPFEQVAMIENALSHGLERILQEMSPLPGNCPIEEILDRASLGYTPNSTLFQNEVLALLSHSRPSKLCRVLGRAMGKAEKELRDLGFNMDKVPREEVVPMDQAALEGARQPFNKLRLLCGLLGLYLIPEISQPIERYRDEYLKEVL